MEEEQNLFEETASADNSEVEDVTPETTTEMLTETSVETPDTPEVDPDEALESAGFSNKPKGTKEFDKIQVEEDFPKEGMTITIESVEAQKLYPTDMPLMSKFGEYYKKKLILNFAESFNDRKLRELIPSVFYTKKDGIATPSLPKPCTEEELTGDLISKLAKLRRMYITAFKAEDKLSDEEFLTGLVGKKVHVTKFKGTYNGTDYALLSIDKFIVDSTPAEATPEVPAEPAVEPTTE